MEFLKANIPFAVSALTIMTGYFLKHLGVFREQDGETLAKVALNVTLPALVLLNVPELPLKGANAGLPLFALLTSLVSVTLALRLFRKFEDSRKGFALMALSGFNIGLFAIPMVSGVYGSEGIARFALIDVGNVVSVFIIANLMGWRYSPLHDQTGIRLKDIGGMFFRSIPFMAYLLAIVFNLSGFRIGGMPAEFLGVLADMNRGVALLTLGILLRFRMSAATRRLVVPPLILRFVLGLIIGGIILFLFPMPVENRVAVASVLVMPMGLTIVPFSLKWGYDRDAAAAVINAAIPFSFVLFWLIWLVGRSIS